MEKTAADLYKAWILGLQGIPLEMVLIPVLIQDLDFIFIFLLIFFQKIEHFTDRQKSQKYRSNT